MPIPWSTQQLAEFLAAVSSARTEVAAAWATVERTAEALDAEVAAIVSGGEVLAAVGYPEGTVPAEELAALAPGVGGALTVPGLGVCSATAVRLGHPADATLVVARSGAGLGRQEASLLRGIAHASSTTMRMLRLLDDERAARAEDALRQRRLEQLVNEQAALRRVATLVARGAPPDAVFAAVTAEVGRMLGADYTAMSRYDPDRVVTVLGAWNSTGADLLLPVGDRVELGGRNVTTQVFQTGRPARLDDYTDASGVISGLAHKWGTRSTVGVPISVEGRLWGLMNVLFTRAEPPPADTEARLAGFTELVATAIANAESQKQLTESRARIVAAADHTRRRIERDLHDGAQQRLISLALGLRTAQGAMPPGATELRARLGSLAAEATSAMDELRELARGIHPAILADGGLRPALKALARRCAVPVELAVGVDGRLPEQIEIAAYCVISEALTNAAKHADASVVGVQAVAVDGVLRIEVRDDGRGGADVGAGSGLVGLKDRVEALRGTLRIDSPPGEGTVLHTMLPITAA
jgi:signal transduction histidine kinase